MEAIKSGWNKITMSIVHCVEKCFYNLGVLVAVHPWRTVALSWIFVAISSLGLLTFYQEQHPLKLWVPTDSDFARDTNWLFDKFHIGYRPQYILATAPNVLDPSVLTELAKINKKIEDIEAEVDNKILTWTDICFKVPIISMLIANNRKRRSPAINSSISTGSLFDDDFFTDSGAPIPPLKNFDPSVDLDPRFYCSILEGFELGCLQKSLLDLWKYNISVISNLSQKDIIDKINTTSISPVLGHNMEYTSTLGGIEKDDAGKIVSAKSLLLVWLVHVNFSRVDMDKTGNLAGTEEWASETSLAWEQIFLDVMHNVSHNVTGLNIYFEAGRSYGDLSGETMFQDMDRLSLGITMMFIYIQLILSKFSWVEVRFTLGSVGLLCVGMALLVACGLCSLMGIPFGPVHSSLPFLLMGLGIDDMFVMKACWDQLTESDKQLPLPKQVGLMLQHAGVSIVITSFTDIVAFLVGSITILPSLQSFCLYAALGVFFIFIFSVTFYVAIFVLDERRMRDKRNGVLFCIKHPNYIARESKKSISQVVIHQLYSKVMFTKPMKIFVIIFTVIMTGFSLEALFRLEQRFDPAWFIPENTYYKAFLDERQLYYPEMGNEAFVYIGAVNYSQELPKIFAIVNSLNNETDILHSVDAWTEPFRTYVLTNFDIDIQNTKLSDAKWDLYLSKFLFSPSGAQYQTRFRFIDDITCGKPAPPVSVSTIEFRFKTFSGPKVYLPAMHRVKQIVKEANFTTGDQFATVWAKVFANWVSDEIIDLEVERNLELALVCVMACTVVLITDIQMCFWIFACVLLTLVNVCGWMQRWGLTVDIVSCVGLELAVGLCVDYAAHVGHTFLTVQGTRQERAFKTVTSIGAAVLYGGGSTMLSLSVLSTSKTYIFKSFFKIFFLVIIFGLFHGIVFLPVILSLIGPKAYKKKPDKTIKNRDSEKHLGTHEELETINLDK